MLKLKCKKCGVDYDKPDEYDKWSKESKNVFFRWSISYCDDCRKEKEINALKELPKVIEAIANQSHNPLNQ
jgi:hypothetical protein